MKMRNTATLLLSAALLAGALPNLRAQATEAAAPAAPSAPAWSFLLTPSVASQYMFRGVRLGGAAFQPSIEADYGTVGLATQSLTVEKGEGVQEIAIAPPPAAK